MLLLSLFIIGSSPRLRGTGKCRTENPPNVRFIPAPAGNRRLSQLVKTRRPVHPRACGEQPYVLLAQPTYFGSSPRLRGTAVRPVGTAHIFRFIPAPAGNSTPPPPKIPAFAVHPRACGEQGDDDQKRKVMIGSSPRLRGTVLTRVPRTHNRRFIPAPAGNRASEPPWMAVARVHPRACGEQYSAQYQSMTRIGSSPRLRGTVKEPIAQVPNNRFIPAPAGNRIWTSHSRLHRPVHPRACGEQSNTSFHNFSTAGSSPRLRGTVRGRGFDLRLDRFIPAPAGNRFPLQCQSNPLPVHPRACGEQTLQAVAASPISGSSPRLRGTGYHRNQPCFAVRFIPAPAGNR